MYLWITPKNFCHNKFSLAGYMVANLATVGLIELIMPENNGIAKELDIVPAY